MPRLELNKNYEQLQGQRKAILHRIEAQPANKIPEFLKKHIVGEIPSGNRSVLLCAFLGNEFSPFVYACNFSTPRWNKMQSQVGELFEIVIKNEYESISNFEATGEPNQPEEPVLQTSIPLQASDLAEVPEC